VSSGEHDPVSAPREPALDLDDFDALGRPTSLQRRRIRRTGLVGRAWIGTPIHLISSRRAQVPIHAHRNFAGFVGRLDPIADVE